MMKIVFIRGTDLLLGVSLVAGCSSGGSTSPMAGAHARPAAADPAAQGHCGRHDVRDARPLHRRASRCSSPASRSPRRWGATSPATAATTPARQASARPSLYYDPALNHGVAGGANGRDRSRGLLDRRRVVRVLEAADEQHRVRVGRGHLARSSGPSSTRRAPPAPTRCAALRDWVQHLAGRSQHDRRVVIPGRHGANNPLGWPGFWPTLQPFTQFDPRIDADATPRRAARSAPTTTPAPAGALICDDYECDSTTLHLPDRAAQVDMTIGPGASGWAGWK